MLKKIKYCVVNSHIDDNVHKQCDREINGTCLMGKLMTSLVLSRRSMILKCFAVLI